MSSSFTIRRIVWGFRYGFLLFVDFGIGSSVVVLALSLQVCEVHYHLLLFFGLIVSGCLFLALVHLEGEILGQFLGYSADGHSLVRWYLLRLLTLLGFEDVQCFNFLDE